MNKLKISIDIHNCIDAKPAFFRTFIDRARANGHIIYILTGSQKKPKILKQLEDLGIRYDHFLSVADYLIAQGIDVHFENSNNPWFDDVQWNTTKAKICADIGIDLHIDDSDIYGKHFVTPYMQLKG